MQKLKLQQVWDDNTKSFSKTQFELRESDKVISGKVAISTNKNNNWISKAIPFVAFKSKIDELTKSALLHSKGRLFDAEFNIVVDEFTDKETQKSIKFFKLIINEARFDDSVDKHNQAKANGYQQEQELGNDEIPW